MLQLVGIFYIICWISMLQTGLVARFIILSNLLKKTVFGWLIKRSRLSCFQNTKEGCWQKN
mgnify:CR=1 FL=1